MPSLGPDERGDALLYFVKQASVVDPDCGPKLSSSREGGQAVEQADVSQLDASSNTGSRVSAEDSSVPLEISRWIRTFAAALSGYSPAELQAVAAAARRRSLERGRASNAAVMDDASSKVQTVPSDTSRPPGDSWLGELESLGTEAAALLAEGLQKRPRERVGPEEDGKTSDETTSPSLAPVWPSPEDFEAAALHDVRPSGMVSMGRSVAAVDWESVGGV